MKELNKERYSDRPVGVLDSNAYGMNDGLASLNQVVRTIKSFKKYSAMNKILIIGCPGSGKSTFAKALQEITHLPLIHLDLLYWNADKSTVSQEVFVQRLNTVLALEQWIIDGNYAATMEKRLNLCDTVFYLDYPLEVCLQGIEQRKGKPRSDMPWIETGEPDPEFIAFVHNFPKVNRYEIIKLLNNYSHLEIHVFKNRKQANAYLHTLANSIIK